MSSVMTPPHDEDATSGSAAAAPPRPARRSSLASSLFRLIRPTQWSKSVFVMIGPLYGLRDLMANGRTPQNVIGQALAAAAAFALISSVCYIINDIFDREADRAHPRKRNRPIAAGRVTVGQAAALAAVLVAGAIAVTMFVSWPHTWKVLVLLGVYAANVFLYSARLKHHIMADVISLALGFVIRVLAGCLAVGIEPSVWLMNVTFFLSMFLAFGKRLGERRTLAVRPVEPRRPRDAEEAPGGLDEEAPAAAGEAVPPPAPRPQAHSAAAAHRRVQARYTDTLLQIAVVVTAAITLMAYALYVQDQAQRFHLGYRMWLTVLPMTYGLFRCIVLLEEGAYDDPTEIAIRDRGMQLAGLVFVALTAAMMLLRPSGE